MGRSRIFTEVARIARIAGFANRHGLDARTAAADFAAEQETRRLSRRALLGGAGVAAAAGLGISALSSHRALGATRNRTKVAIIGGGLAGLACADTLAKWGIAATIFEAHPTRVGGRCFSNRDTFPGQVAENGGELIDTPHKTMIGYARELGLPLEDLEKAPGASTFYFSLGGPNYQHYSEAEVVDQYRALVNRMRPDLQALSGAPTFYAHNAADVILDNMTLKAYLDWRADGLPLINAVLDEAYVAEYGLECAQQSPLNMLLFIHLDRSSKFREFGVFSDERYHVIGGNDAIAHGLADRIPGTIYYGATLSALTRSASGKYQLYFNGSTSPDATDWDAVVCAIPFSVLRGVRLDPSLGLSADKLRAINELGYGANAKTMIGFDHRVWAEQGRDGLAYSNIPNVQNTWETNYSVGAPNGILTDYSGGDRGAELQRNAAGNFGCGGCHAVDGPPALNDGGNTRIQGQAEAFLLDLDKVWPGALAAAAGQPGSRLVQRGHWLSQRYSRGSYTCYKPGQFTGIAGLEAEPAGGLKFAGEHADSFYAWQGFMEGACNSGIAAADSILDDIKARRLPS